MERKPLNSRQVEVLKWIAEGCADGVWQDFTYKTTARALQGRRLAKVSKRGGWHAEITEDGRYYLEHGRYPDEPPARAKTSVPRKRPNTEKQKPQANRKAVPRQLTTANQTPVDAPVLRVAVPQQLRGPHPVVAALRDDRQRFALAPAVRSRALRILQGLATAAEEQGYRVREVRELTAEYGYKRWESTDHFIIETGEAKIGVRVVQQTDRTPHVPTRDELDRQQRWGPTPPKYDHTPNELLRIELSRSWDGRQSSWSEGKRGPLEARLPAILAEIGDRHKAAKEQRLKRKRDEAERERKRQMEAIRAEKRARHAHRARVLRKQAADWREAQTLREYIAAMEERIDDDPPALVWVAWAKRYVEELDPLNRPIETPKDPKK